MKINLQDENYNWKEFQYEKLSDLTSEFESRKIKIGDSATIGLMNFLMMEVKDQNQD